jgi:hypothetical protein
MVLMVGLAYGAYPYMTLYRLGGAIQRSDAKALEAMVDWPSVREGIKEDICDLVTDEPAVQTSGSLPPFGASFMRGIASSAIDQAVTPQALLAATATAPSKPVIQDRQGADIHVNWAFFDGLTSFLVSLQARGQTDPIKIEMDLRHGAWQIQRVWLPAELLSPAGSRT